MLQLSLTNSTELCRHYLLLGRAPVLGPSAPVAVSIPGLKPRVSELWSLKLCGSSNNGSLEFLICSSSQSLSSLPPLPMRVIDWNSLQLPFTGMPAIAPLVLLPSLLCVVSLVTVLMRERKSSKQRPTYQDKYIKTILTLMMGLLLGHQCLLVTSLWRPQQATLTVTVEIMPSPHWKCAFPPSGCNYNAIFFWHSWWVQCSQIYMRAVQAAQLATFCTRKPDKRRACQTAHFWTLLDICAVKYSTVKT